MSFAGTFVRQDLRSPDLCSPDLVRQDLVLPGPGSRGPGLPGRAPRPGERTHPAAV